MLGAGYGLELSESVLNIGAPKRLKMMTSGSSNDESSLIMSLESKDRI